MPAANEIQSSSGKLGVLLPGLGAVATTFVAGVEAVRQGIAKPFGSLTQMSRIRLGRRTECAGRWVLRHRRIRMSRGPFSRDPKGSAWEAWACAVRAAPPWARNDDLTGMEATPCT